MRGAPGERAGSPGGGGAGGGPRDRRAAFRAAIEIPALLRLGSRDVDCAVRDLSSHGIALSVSESVPPGMVVRVVFRLPNARQPVEVAGIATRSEGGRYDGTLALRFVDPDPDAQRTIDIFVARNRSDEPFSRRRRPGRRPADGDGAGRKAGASGRRGGLFGFLRRKR